MRDLTQLAIELDEPRREVVEAAVCLLAIVIEDERVDLPLQELDVRGERQDVLDRPVVEVEPEAHQPTLRRRDECPLAARRIVEEMLTLDDMAQRRRALLEIGVRNALLDRPDAPDDRRIGLAEAEDRRRPQLRTAEEREPRALSESRLRLRARAATRTAVVAERDDAVEPSRRSYPQRHVAEHIEAEEQSELELDGHERWQLEQARVSHHLAEEHVSRRCKRQCACLGNGRAGTAYVGLVELQRRAQFDDRGRRVPDRRQAVSDFVVGVACVHASCVGENGLEHGADLVRAPLEEVRVQALEARLWSAIRLALRLRRAGERG